MVMTTTVCNDGEGHGEKARRDDDGRHGAMTTMTAYNDDDDDNAQWHAAQQCTARTMTSSLHQANRQCPPLLAQYHRSP